MQTWSAWRLNLLKIPKSLDLPRSEWERLIHEWIFNEQHREMVKLNLLDGWTYEKIAEKYGMPPRQIARILPGLEEHLFKKIK